MRHIQPVFVRVCICGLVFSYGCVVVVVVAVVVGIVVVRWWVCIAAAAAVVAVVVVVVVVVVGHVFVSERKAFSVSESFAKE